MYDNIFTDIKPRSGIGVYEDHFASMTNQIYREFLFNIYVKEDKPNSYIANLLGVNQSVVSSHIRRYEIKKECIVDTTNIMHKTPSIIEKETGRKFIDVYNELANQGLSLTEITVKLQIKNVSTVSTYLHKHKQREEKKLNPPDESKLIIKGLSGKNNETVEVMFYNELGIEYKDFLKQKYIDEQLTLDEISELIGISPTTLSVRMKEYGFHKTKSQLRHEAMKRGTINYDNILSKGRKTRSKSKSLSHSQDLLITLIKHNLELAFTELDNIEIILGYNEYCILGSMEVDIPIIIFKGDKVYKIALEYDGDVWHEARERVNKLKETQLKEKKWHYINVIEVNTESGKLGIVEDKAKYIVNQILKFIEASN